MQKFQEGTVTIIVKQDGHQVGSFPITTLAAFFGKEEELKADGPGLVIEYYGQYGASIDRDQAVEFLSLLS